MPIIIQDPFTLKSGQYLRELFPNSKFLFMVRDGRATVHSIISRKVTITGAEKCIRQLNRMRISPICSELQGLI